MGRVKGEGIGKKRMGGILLGMAVSGCFLAVFLYGLHWEELQAIPSRINAIEVAIAVIILFFEFPLRALRWSILLGPLKKGTGSSLTLPKLMSFTFIGFMSNNILPARAGELIRPWMASRQSKVPFESLIVTCALERGFDLIGLGSVALLMALLLPTSGAAAMDSILLTTLTDYAAVLVALSVFGLSVMAMMVLKSAQLLPVFERVASIFPAPIERLMVRILNGLFGGLSSLGSGSSLLGAIGVSVLIWLNGALAIWVLLGAFGVALPLAAACFLQVTIALAVVLPQAPGFIGVFQVATETTLLSWGVGVGVAQGFAVVFWLVSFVPVTLAGLFALWMEGRSLRALAQESQGEASAQIDRMGE